MSDRGRFAAHSHVTGDVYGVATRLRYADPPRPGEVEGRTVYALREARTFPATGPRLASGRSAWNRMTWPWYYAVTRSPISWQLRTPSSGLETTRRAACSR